MLIETKQKTNPSHKWYHSNDQGVRMEVGRVEGKLSLEILLEAPSLYILLFNDSELKWSDFAFLR